MHTCTNIYSQMCVCICVRAGEHTIPGGLDQNENAGGPKSVTAPRHYWYRTF